MWLTLLYSNKNCYLWRHTYAMSSAHNVVECAKGVRLHRKLFGLDLDQPQNELLLKEPPSYFVFVQPSPRMAGATYAGTVGLKGTEPRKQVEQYLQPPTLPSLRCWNRSVLRMLVHTCRVVGGTPFGIRAFAVRSYNVAFCLARCFADGPRRLTPFRPAANSGFRSSAKSRVGGAMQKKKSVC